MRGNGHVVSEETMSNAALNAWFWRRTRGWTIVVLVILCSAYIVQHAQAQASAYLEKDIDERSGIGIEHVLDNTVLGKHPFVVSGGILFFVVRDAHYGDELWRSDGTVAGTRLLKDIEPGSGGSLGYAPRLQDVNGTLFFSTETSKYGAALWKSDGTTTGTVLVKDLPEPNTDDDEYSYLMENVGSTLFFSAFVFANDGVNLW